MRGLLQRARSGDGKAFAELFQQHAGDLWRTSMGCLRNESDAADALQETALKAWRSLPSFDERSDISTWLTRILLNTCFDALRARKRLIPFADIVEPWEGGTADGRIPNENDAGYIDHVASSTIDRLDVESVLAQMSVNDRTMLTLFYVNDMPIKQISEVLGISDGAVRTRLVRARERFKDLYMRSISPEDREEESASKEPASSAQRVTRPFSDRLMQGAAL